MTWQEKAFSGKRAEKDEKIELTQTSPATLKLLEEKARAIADTAASQEQFTDEEIHQMALILASHAESQGEPLDEEIISDPNFEYRIINALDARNKMRGGEARTYLIPEDGSVIGSVNSPAEAKKMAEEDRDNRETL